MTLLHTRIFAARLLGSKRTVASFLGLDDGMDSPDKPEPAPPAKASALDAADGEGAATATGSGPHELHTVHAQEQEDCEFQDLVARYTF